MFRYLLVLYSNAYGKLLVRDFVFCIRGLLCWEIWWLIGRFALELVYIFTSYTTINIIIHTIKCYNFNDYMFRSPLRPSSGQILQIVRLQCAYKKKRFALGLLVEIHAFKYNFKSNYLVHLIWVSEIYFQLQLMYRNGHISHEYL